MIYGGNQKNGANYERKRNDCAMEKNKTNNKEKPVVADCDALISVYDFFCCASYGVSVGSKLFNQG